MIKRIFISALALITSFVCFTSCYKSNSEISIGVSFGVGAAARWPMEQKHMEEHAKKLGVNIEVRLNKSDEPKTQQQDCFEMIDNGIDVLILTPRDVNNVRDILEYAKKKRVPVISYARIVLGTPIDLFVGYDSNRIGQKMGQYLSETVTSGNYIFLQGPSTDNNATLLYDGAMRYLDPIRERDDINIILDAEVSGWNPDVAKKMVTEAITKNANKIDAILAPNDAIANACAEAITELGITDDVIITGMDAELSAAQRILNGKQSSTIYMDLQDLAHTAIEEAVHFAKGEKVNVNAEFDNHSGTTINANLITGQIVTKDNLDRVLIDSGYLNREDVYGK